MLPEETLIEEDFNWCRKLIWGRSLIVGRKLDLQWEKFNWREKSIIREMKLIGGRGNFNCGDKILIVWENFSWPEKYKYGAGRKF